MIANPVSLRQSSTDELCADMLALISRRCALQSLIVGEANDIGATGRTDRARSLAGALMSERGCRSARRGRLGRSHVTPLRPRPWRHPASAPRHATGVRRSGT